MLNQAVQILDFRSKETDRLVSEILTNKRIMDITECTSAMDSSKRLKIGEIIKDLSMYSAGNSMINNMYLYLPQYDMIISNSGMYSSKVFYDSICTPPDISYNKMMDLLNGNSNTKKILEISFDNRIYNMVLHLRRIYNNSKLIIFVDLKNYEDIFSELVESSEGYYYIIDNSDDLFLTNDTEGKHIYSIDWKSNNGSVANASDMIMISSLSDYNSFRYVLLVPKSVYMHEIDKIKAYTVFLIILCLIIGIIAAYLLANKNYSPIKKIMNYIKDISANDNTGCNEYEIIESAIQSSHHEITELKETFKKQQPVLRSKFLADFIKGRLETPEEIVDKSGVLDLDLDFSEYRIVLLHMGREKTSNGEEMIKNSLLNMVDAELIEQYINRNCKGYAIEIENDRIALILGSNKAESDEKLIYNEVIGLKRYLDDKIPMDIAVGISCMFREIKEIGKAYEQAERTLNFCIITGKNIAEFNEVSQASDTYQFSMVQEMHLSNFIKAGDGDAAKKLLDTIYRENIQEKDLSPERIKCLIYNIYNTILKTVWELNVDIGEDWQVNEFLLQEDIRKIFSKFKEKIGSICEIIKYKKENKNKRLINEVISYIDNNLTDYNLNLSAIEQKFNRSGKYLSKVFKEETNCNFVDYINSKKVELAKEYLTSLSISDTCEKAGLASMSTFMRVFKKYTGLSPGQYQDMYKRKL
ncbi:MAG: helix-turn-helix domain-containing protein [Clostridiaceae bacterium]